jgi:putative transposase
MDKFKNKYRIPSARLKNWDYGSNGAYYITICTQNRECFFGEIVDMQFIASEIGKLAEKFWLEIPNHFPFVELGNFVVMPNHTHGILVINKMDNVDGGPYDHGDGDGDGDGDGMVEKRLIASLPSTTAQPSTTDINGGFAGTKNPMFHENISRIIRWYKGRCSFEIRKIHADFAWQPRFHDHIIRDSQSFERIQTYIENNPKNWKEDKF